MPERHVDLGGGEKMDRDWWIATKLTIMTIVVGGTVLFLFSLL